MRCSREPAVAVRPVVSGREEGGHRVGMGIVQLDPVEPRLSRPLSGVGEEVGQDEGQVADVRQVEIGHPLPVATLVILQLAGGQHLGEAVFRQSEQGFPHLRLRPVRRDLQASQCGAVPPGHLEVAPEVDLPLRPSADGQEVDDLDEKAGPPAARPAHGLDQLPKAGEEAVVPDPQERSARHVADPGRLDDDRPRLSGRETLVPGEHLRGDEPLVRSPPGHHRRHPGPLGELDPPKLEGLKEERCRRLLPARPAARRERVADALGGFPHKLPEGLLGSGFRNPRLPARALGSGSGLRFGSRHRPGCRGCLRCLVRLRRFGRFGPFGNAAGEKKRRGELL